MQVGLVEAGLENDTAIARRARPAVRHGVSRPVAGRAGNLLQRGLSADCAAPDSLGGWQRMESRLSAF